MRKYPPEVIAELKKYRKQGHSIHEIMEKFSMPKTSVWHHIQGVEIDPKHRIRLRARQGGSRPKSQREWKRASEEAKELLEGIDVEKIMPVVLAALYWGEGRKKGVYAFANTDKAMIEVFLKILKETFGVEKKDITALIRITNKHNDRRCIEYWQKGLGLPRENIRIDKNNIQNKSRSQYGMCRIYVKRGGYMLKLTHCLVKELTAKIKSV